MTPRMDIDWTMSGTAIEAESFRRIEAEMGPHRFTPPEWRVVRRMIHACADFAVAEQIHFGHDPVAAGLHALRDGVPLYCDANMIRAGLSLARLRQCCPTYARESVHCHVADADVARLADARHIARSLAALEKARPVLDGGIVLIGNAPLALAGIARLIAEEGIRPRLVIAMPVGFVHVEESKALILDTDVPQIVLRGRRGGSALAVAALHGIIESVATGGMAE